MAAFNTYGNATDLEAFLVQQDTGDAFRKLPKARVAHSVGLTGADEGKSPIINSSGELAWGMISPAISVVETQTLSAASSAAFTTGFSSDYDEYIFQFIGIRAGTDDATLLCEFSENSGSSYISSYNWQSTYDNSAGTNRFGGDTGTSGIELARNIDTLAGSSLGGKASVVVSSTKSWLTGEFNSLDSTAANTRTTRSSGAAASSSRVNAIRFRMGSGTITGTIRMLRMRNT